MNNRETAEQIAATIMEDGWKWSGPTADGHKLVQIVTELYLDLKGSVKPKLWKLLATRQIVLLVDDEVKTLAVENGWDAPRMSPAVEQAFWTFVTEATVKDLCKAEGKDVEPDWLHDALRGNPPR